MAELKRVNGLYTEQDFFAHRTLKIPVRRNGVLTEKDELQKREPRPGALPLLHKSAPPSKSKHVVVNSLEDVELSGGEMATPSPRHDVKPFLNRMDKELAAVREMIEEKGIAAEEDEEAAALARIAPDVGPLVNAHEEFESKAEEVVEKSKFCDTSWRTIAFIAFLIFLIIPVYYVISVTSQEGSKKSGIHGDG